MASYSAVSLLLRSLPLRLCVLVPLRIVKSPEFWAILERKELSAELATCGFPSGLRSCCPKSYPYLGIFDDRPPCAHAAQTTHGLRPSRAAILPAETANDSKHPATAAAAAAGVAAAAGSLALPMPRSIGAALQRVCFPASKQPPNTCFFGDILRPDAKVLPRRYYRGQSNRVLFFLLRISLRRRASKGWFNEQHRLASWQGVP